MHLVMPNHNPLAPVDCFKHAVFVFCSWLILVGYINNYSGIYCCTSLYYHVLSFALSLQTPLDLVQPLAFVCQSLDGFRCQEVRALLAPKIDPRHKNKVEAGDCVKVLAMTFSLCQILGPKMCVVYTIPIAMNRGNWYVSINICSGLSTRWEHQHGMRISDHTCE